MKHSFIVCSLSISLLSCSSDSNPLTDIECKAVADKEAAHLAKRFDKFPEMRAGILGLAESRAAQCLEGKAFDRQDYKCVMDASSDSDMDGCLKMEARNSP